MFILPVVLLMLLLLLLLLLKKLDDGVMGVASGVNLPLCARGDIGKMRESLFSTPGGRKRLSGMTGVVLVFRMTPRSLCLSFGWKLKNTSVNKGSKL